jgi:transposase
MSPKQGCLGIKTKIGPRAYDIEGAGLNTFNTIRRTVETHYNNLINEFNSRITNVAAESFNAKIKDFRRQFRGVTDVNFFLYRLAKVYA